MTPFKHTHIWLALGCLAAAALSLVIWIPQDVDTGLIEKIRRQVTIGDALAPTLATAIIALGAGLLLIQRPDPIPSGISLTNLLFLAALLSLFGLAFAVMRWAGPALVGLVTLMSDDPRSYRDLRDTAPWKYIGFLLGSTGLITTCIAAIETRFSWRALLIALAATTALIALYDLPFDDLLLPPNGDV